VLGGLVTGDEPLDEVAVDAGVRDDLRHGEVAVQIAPEHGVDDLVGRSQFALISLALPEFRRGLFLDERLGEREVLGELVEVGLVEVGEGREVDRAVAVLREVAEFVLGFVVRAEHQIVPGVRGLVAVGHSDAGADVPDRGLVEVSRESVADGRDRGPDVVLLVRNAQGVAEVAGVPHVRRRTRCAR